MNKEGVRLHGGKTNITVNGFDGIEKEGRGLVTEKKMKGGDGIGAEEEESEEVKDSTAKNKNRVQNKNKALD